MTIQEIKEAVRDTEPYYFSDDTMKSFGQKLRDFKIRQMNDGRYMISAYSPKSGDCSIRFFNPNNNRLEFS